MLQSWERVQEAKSLHQIWQSYWSLLIKTGKGKGNQSLGNSIHSFNPLSKYFIFKTQAQPSAKLRDCVGPWGVLNFWALFTPTPPRLPIVPQPFLLSGCIFLTSFSFIPWKPIKKKKKKTYLLALIKKEEVELPSARDLCSTSYPLVTLNCCSVAHSCLTLCDPMYCSTPGFPVLHHLQDLAQTHVHWVSDAIQPSHPLSSPSPAFSLSQHQGLF